MSPGHFYTSRFPWTEPVKVLNRERDILYLTTGGNPCEVKVVDDGLPYTLVVDGQQHDFVGNGQTLRFNFEDLEANESESDTPHEVEAK